MQLTNLSISKINLNIKNFLEGENKENLHHSVKFRLSLAYLGSD